MTLQLYILEMQIYFIRNSIFLPESSVNVWCPGLLHMSRLTQFVYPGHVVACFPSSLSKALTMCKFYCRPKRNQTLPNVFILEV